MPPNRTALARLPAAAPLALPPDDIEAARRYAEAARAAGTRQKYQAAWRAFARWCAAGGHDSLPAAPGGR